MESFFLTKKSPFLWLVVKVTPESPLATSQFVAV